jgi:hypothetical protein
MEKRLYKRTSYPNEIICSVSIFKDREIKHIDLRCEATDLSEKGIGFFTDYPLENGHVIRFSNGKVNKKIGVVKWCRKDGERYKVGVMFVP